MARPVYADKEISAAAPAPIFQRGLIDGVNSTPHCIERGFPCILGDAPDRYFNDIKTAVITQMTEVGVLVLVSEPYQQIEARIRNRVGLLYRPASLVTPKCHEVWARKK